MKCSASTTPHWIYLGIEQGRKCPGSGVWEKHRLLSIIFIIATSYLQSIKCLAMRSVLCEYYLVQSLWDIMSTTPHISYKQPHTLSTAKLSAFTQRKIPQKTNSNVGLSDSSTLLSLSLLWSSLGPLGPPGAMLVWHTMNHPPAGRYLCPVPPAQACTAW